MKYKLLFLKSQAKSLNQFWNWVCPHHAKGLVKARAHVFDKKENKARGKERLSGGFLSIVVVPMRWRTEVSELQDRALILF